MAAKPRVLWVDHVSRILGGAEVNLLELLTQSSAASEWESTVACDPRGRLHERLAEAKIRTLSYGLDSRLGTLRVVGSRFPLLGAVRSLRTLAKARRDLRTLIDKVKPDAVVSCTNKDHFAAWPGCRNGQVPCIWWVNDVLSPEFFPWAARRLFCLQSRRGANRLVVVSNYARRALEREGARAEQIVTIHNGIPVERYQRRARGTLRRLLNMNQADNAWLAGVLGRFTPWKGQDFFLNIAEAWCRKRPQGHFVLIGHAFNEDQRFEQDLRERVKQQGLRERIHFVPFQSDVVSVLSDLDVLLHTSRKPEPFGRVIIEAMATGVPVIAARDGGVPEIISHGKDGLLATPGDPGHYLAQMETLYADAALGSRMATAARETVLARFSLARVQSDFDALFRERP